jgi:predicted O-methyltransferase YrrM
MRALLVGMFGSTTRQRLAAVAVLGAGLAIVVLALMRQWVLATAVVGLLLTATLLAHLGLRRRLAQLHRASMARLAETQTGEVERTRRELKMIGESQKVLLRELSALKSSLENERRYQSDERRKQGEFRQRSIDIIRSQPQEVEALLQLYDKVTPLAPMPPSAGWALKPAGLLNLYALTERWRPKLVLELGSGTSTVWIAYALTGNGRGRLISLDHLEEYAARTRAALELHDLSGRAEIRYAPLNDVRVGEQTFQWYDRSALDDLHDIDMVFVDGPPGSTGPDARYPALPILLDRLADGAVIVLDDIDRPDEQEIVDRWLKDTPGLFTEVTLGGHQSVLRYRTGSSTARNYEKG